MATEMNADVGSRILVWLNHRATHRTVLKRHGELVIRVQGGYDKLSLYRPSRLGSGTVLWKWL